MAEQEVEITGNREDVMMTIDNLPSLVNNVHKAFENARPKTTATLTVKTETAKQEARAHSFPEIIPTDDCNDAIMKMLETDWGKWRPRTAEELGDALKANGLNFSGQILARVLSGLVKKGTVRHWNTNAGDVYILAEKESFDLKKVAK